MIGALATITDPSRFAKLVLLTPSPCYIDDGDYRGGFSKADIDELLESLEQNYLGWSRAMAPVIMGNPDRPELAGRVGATPSARTDPEHARVFARTTFLSDNRADLARIPLPTLVIECAQDAIAPREVGAYVHAQIPDSQLSPWRRPDTARTSAPRRPPHRRSPRSPARRDRLQRRGLLGTRSVRARDRRPRRTHHPRQRHRCRDGWDMRQMRCAASRSPIC